MRALYFVATSAAVAVLFLAGPGLAGEHGDGEHDGERDRGGRASRGAPATAAASPAQALYVKECGSCHLAYPPGYLPAASWTKTMAGLERHFGQNAELDAETSAALERYLVDNAAESGSDRKSRKILSSLGGAAPLRVSETPYFQRKHRELDARVVARPSIRSWANCGACHGGAKEWDFSEDRVRIPAK